MSLLFNNEGRKFCIGLQRDIDAPSQQVKIPSVHESDFLSFRKEINRVQNAELPKF